MAYISHGMNITQQKGNDNSNFKLNIYSKNSVAL